MRYFAPSDVSSSNELPSVEIEREDIELVMLDLI